MCLKPRCTHHLYFNHFIISPVYNIVRAPESEGWEDRAASCLTSRSEAAEEVRGGHTPPFLRAGGPNWGSVPI